MHSVVCANCGAPLNVRPEELATGFVTCPYCQGSTKVADKVVVDASAKPADPRVSIGRDNLRLMPDELDAPAPRPADTAIEITQEPGVRFRLTMPRQGSAGGPIVTITALLALLGATVPIGMSFPKAWPLLIAAGCAAIAVAVLANLLRRKESQIAAENGKLVIGRNGMFPGRTFALAQIAGIHFGPFGTVDSGAKAYGLFATVGKQEEPLWEFFLLTTGAEQRWILSELRRFLASAPRRATQY